MMRWVGLTLTLGFVTDKQDKAEVMSASEKELRIYYSKCPLNVLPGALPSRPRGTAAADTGRWGDTHCLDTQPRICKTQMVYPSLGMPVKPTTVLVGSH